ncbi:MAG: ABC transporter permease [Aureispira sp.]|nr:ABC transporter permease [Aureispira sp.]
MNKLGLIIRREYLTRVKKKAFILTTILAPIGMLIFWVVLIFLMSSGQESRRLAVLDEGNILELNTGKTLRDNNSLTYKYMPNAKVEELRDNLGTEDLDGIIYIPKQNVDSLGALRTLNIEYYSDDQLGVTTLEGIKSTIANYVEKLKIEKSGVDENLLKSFDTDVHVDPKNADPEKAEEEVSSYRVYVATFLGGAMMFLIYIVIFVYGTMVMRSVQEEKTNRIVEVIISSVKPFQLMLGKIIGVGMVGLTQFAIWAVVFPLLYMGMGLVFADKFKQMQSMAEAPSADAPDASEITAIIQELWSFDYSEIVIVFILFFLAGYILYSSMFAAIGASMGDDQGESQSLTLIVSIPVIIAFYIGVAAIQNPNSSLAFWSSMFPLFSPIIMPARIVFDPPMWQVLLSLGLLIGTCLLFVWLTGRIYRVGILMYGKKTTIREMARWIFRKD